MSEIDVKLEDILAWTNDKLAEGNEPPWSWYQFMKLREAIEAIRAGVSQVPMGVDLPELPEHQEIDPLQEGCIAQIDTARRRRESREPQKPN